MLGRANKWSASCSKKTGRDGRECAGWKFNDVKKGGNFLINYSWNTSRYSIYSLCFGNWYKVSVWPLIQINYNPGFRGNSNFLHLFFQLWNWLQNAVRIAHKRKWNFLHHRLSDSSKIVLRRQQLPTHTCAFETLKRVSRMALTHRRKADEMGE